MSQLIGGVVYHTVTQNSSPQRLGDYLHFLRASVEQILSTDFTDFLVSICKGSRLKRLVDHRRYRDAAKCEMNLALPIFEVPPIYGRPCHITSRHRAKPGGTTTSAGRVAKRIEPQKSPGLTPACLGRTAQGTGNLLAMTFVR